METRVNQTVIRSEENASSIILVIDNSEIDRMLIERMLIERYCVVCCSSAAEALEYLRNNAAQVRLILVDNVMPGMTGLDFLSICQSDAVLYAIPKIMITISDSLDDQVEAFRHGVYDYITKPLVRETVLARVDRVMESGTL